MSYLLVQLFRMYFYTIMIQLISSGSLGCLVEGMLAAPLDIFLVNYVDQELVLGSFSGLSTIPKY